MNRSITIVSHFTDDLYDSLDYGSTVILLFSGDDEKIIINAVAALRKKGVSVARIIVTFKTLGDFIANGIAHSGHSLDVRLEENPNIEEILRQTDLLAKSTRRFVFRLRTPADATMIRVLCSLRIPVLIDMRDEGLHWELLKDLTTEAMLGPIPWTSLDPIKALATSIKGPSAHLAGIYYEDPSQYLWSDGTASLFLNEIEMRRNQPLPRRSEDHWGHSEKYLKAVDREYEILERKRPCAFCDGFFLCKGYLSQFHPDARCKAYMNDFLDILELNLCKLDGQPPCS